MTTEKEKYAVTGAEIPAYSFAFAMRSMLKRGKLTQEQVDELTKLGDQVYIALASGKVVSLGDDNLPLIEEYEMSALGSETLVI